MNKLIKKKTPFPKNFSIKNIARNLKILKSSLNSLNRQRNLKKKKRVIHFPKNKNTIRSITIKNEIIIKILRKTN